MQRRLARCETRACPHPLVGGELIIELKSVEQFAAVHVAQAHLMPKSISTNLSDGSSTFNVPLLNNGIHRVMNSRR